MAKKLNIKGVVVDYEAGDTWNGRTWTKQELEAYAKKSEQEFQDAQRQRREAEQARKSARMKAAADYALSCNVPNNNYTPETLSDSEMRKDALGLSVLIGGGLLFTCVLGFLVLL